MESLVHLAERFEPRAAELATLSVDYGIIVDVYAASDSEQGGFYIGAETMRRLGAERDFAPTVYLIDDATAEQRSDPRNPGQ